ncbi:hypothetical protein [Halosaccharopolyspora lacisalsi]|uniref:hypothetical protein n=1 Tax=Halosaccharopolyspora lacisalsi TaxID=1000566 RepID=UPI001F3FD6FA|nr:hypothetical protein [Halosaccharopolyspora lacisalsi]
MLEIDEHREAMIWQGVSRYAELAGVRPASSAGAAYALLDGAFHRAPLHLLSGRGGAVEPSEDELPQRLDLLSTHG